MSSSLLEALKKLRKDDRMADVVLVCSEGEVKAHRLILSCRSIYFEKMFTSNFKESQADRVKFPNIEIDVMHSILDFIYYESTAKIKKENLDHVIRVHQSSHLLEIKDLTNRCWGLIIASLQIDNVHEIWNAILVYGDEIELAIILQFVLENLETVINKDEFVSVDIKGLKSLMEEIKENNIALTDTILAGIIRWYKHNPGNYFDVEESLGHLNYDYITKDYMKTLLENESSLFTEKFYKQFCISRMFSSGTPKDETKKDKLNAKMTERKYKPPLKFFHFGGYVKQMYERPHYHPINARVALKIIDLQNEANNKTLTEQLPFIMSDKLYEAFCPIQAGSHLYIIGILPCKSPDSDIYRRNYFISYNWENNSWSANPSLPSPIHNPIYAAVVNKVIYIVQDTSEFFSDFHLTILSYSISRKQWKEESFKFPDNLVIGCVNLRETLYMLCWLPYRKSHALYTLLDNQIKFVCEVPIPSCDTSSDYLSFAKTILVHNNKLYVFMVTTTPHMSVYAVLNPDNFHWSLNKLSHNLRSLDPFVGFSVPGDSIYFNLSFTNKLYILQEIDDGNGTIKEFMDVKDSVPHDEQLLREGYRRVEKLLLFQ